MASLKTASVLIVASDGLLQEALRKEFHEPAVFLSAQTEKEARELLSAHEVAVVFSASGGMKGWAESAWPQTLQASGDAKRDAQNLTNAIQIWALRKEVSRWKAAAAKPGDLEPLGSSAAARALYERVTKLAAHEASVLISGEPGSGKAYLARMIHAKSSRLNSAFILHDSSLSKERLAAALTAADTGTLHLPDVEFLPAPAQELLLGALRDRCVGPERVDARVISSTSINLREAVHAGRFREDLYWALCGVTLEVPALRDRGGDAEELFAAFFERACKALNKRAPTLPLTILSKIKAYPFAGNVRELKDLAGVVAALSEGEEVSLAALPAQMLAPLQVGRSVDAASLALKPAVHEFERQYLLRVLKAVGGNQSKAARALDIHRNTLILKMQELGIPNRRRTTSPAEEEAEVA